MVDVKGVLQSILKLGHKDDKDKQITSTEIGVALRKDCDTAGSTSSGKDNFVNNQDPAMTVVRELLRPETKYEGLDDKQIEALKKRIDIAAHEIASPPPADVKPIVDESDPLFGQDRIRQGDSYDGVDEKFVQNLSDDRVSYNRKQVRITNANSLDVIKSFVNPSDTIEAQAAAAAKGVMENADSISNARILRMAELYGAIAYDKEKAGFKDAFLGAMVNYVKDNGSDAQQKAFLDSLLALHNGTAFNTSEESKALGDYLKTLIEKSAKELPAFKDAKEGDVVGYYDGTRDAASGADYGSLALIKTKDGFEFRKTEACDPSQLTEYVFGDEAGAPSGAPSERPMGTGPGDGTAPAAVTPKIIKLEDLAPDAKTKAEQAIKDLGLIPNGDGTYSRPDHKGKYYIQSDGTIFYVPAPGETDAEGKLLTPQTYRGKDGEEKEIWDSSDKGKIPLETAEAPKAAPPPAAGTPPPAVGKEFEYSISIPPGVEFNDDDLKKAVEEGSKGAVKLKKIEKSPDGTTLKLTFEVVDGTKAGDTFTLKVPVKISGEPKILEATVSLKPAPAVAPPPAEGTSPPAK